MQDRLGDKIRLMHIIDAINEIDSYTKDVDLDHFCKNSMMFNATLRQLEIIGEASNRLSAEIVNNNSSVSWARIIGLRNLVIHEYFGVDEYTIWNIIKINLPDLKQKIGIILSEIK